MIEGRLVRLRPAELADAERFSRWFNDQEVTRFLIADRYPVSLAEEERFVRERPPMSFSDGAIFAVETKDGRHIGWTSFYDVHTEDRKACLAVTIGEKECWSQGSGGDAPALRLSRDGPQPRLADDGRVQRAGDRVLQALRFRRGGTPTTGRLPAWPLLGLRPDGHLAA